MNVALTTGNKSNIIAAYGRLLEYSSDKEYKILDKGEYFDDEVGKIAFDLNKIVLKDYGLDLFRILGTEETIEYQRLVKKLLIEFTDKYYRNDELKDFVKVLEGLKEVSQDYYSAKNILPIDSKSRRYYKKTFPITIEHIEEACRRPDYIFASNWGGGSEIFIITTKITSTFRPKILVAVICPNMSRNNGSFSIAPVFLLDFEKNQEFYTRPGILFYRFIEQYGLDFTINGKTQKFFLDIDIPTLGKPFKDVSAFLLKSMTKEPENFLHVFPFSTRSISIHVFIAFGIDWGRYHSDFKSGKV